LRTARTAACRFWTFSDDAGVAAVSEHDLGSPRQHAARNIARLMRRDDQLVIRIVERSQCREVFAEPIVLAFYRHNHASRRPVTALVLEPPGDVIRPLPLAPKREGRQQKGRARQQPIPDHAGRLFPTALGLGSRLGSVIGYGGFRHRLIGRFGRLGYIGVERRLGIGRVVGFHRSRRGVDLLQHFIEQGLLPRIDLGGGGCSRR
jgi:hypothetical protein